MSSSTLHTLCEQENSNAYKMVDYTSDTSKKRFILQVASASKDDSARRVWLLEKDNSEYADFSLVQKRDYTMFRYRQSVCAWAFRIIDSLEADRIIVSIFASALDRFLMMVQCCPEGYKLVALTGIFVALKSHRPSQQVLGVGSIVQLSGGAFDQQDIVEMELLFLNTLSWRINGPTPCCFIEAILQHQFSSCEVATIRKRISIITEYLIHLTVLDASFIKFKPSLIALGSYRMAMRSEGYSDTLIADIDRLLFLAGASYSPLDICSIEAQLANLASQSQSMSLQIAAPSLEFWKSCSKYAGRNKLLVQQLRRTDKNLEHKNAHMNTI